MREVSVSEAIERKYPEQVVLATSVDPKGKANAMPLGWSMITSGKPTMLAISVGHKRHTHKLIEECGEFVLAFPAAGQEGPLLYCGTHSGRDVDKFKESGFKALPAKKVKPPLIAGCVSNFECKVVGKLSTGDHTIFVGEVVAAHIEDEAKVRLYNLGGRKFKGIPAE
jgi:flavin reductase (DIM6/NTAB) family NADH-FMN oxidoreductase RutF